MLGQALAPELQGDVETLRQLVRFEDPAAAFDVVARWRKANAQALIVVDQFEELFTQCPPEAQARFAALLGRLAGEAGVHVVLSMRTTSYALPRRGRSRRCSRADPLGR
jgi:hypothetical protein